MKELQLSGFSTKCQPSGGQIFSMGASVVVVFCSGVVGSLVVISVVVASVVVVSSSVVVSASVVVSGVVVVSSQHSALFVHVAFPSSYR